MINKVRILYTMEIMAIIVFVVLIIVIICIIIKKEIKIKNYVGKNEKRYRLAMESTNVGIWDVDFQECTVFISNKCKEILEINNSLNNYNLDKCKNIFSNEQYKNIKLLIQAFSESEKDYCNKEFTFVTMDGTIKILKCKGKILKNYNGKAYRIAGAVLDVTEKRKFEEKINYLAFHDTLTGLLNNAYVREKLPNIIKRLKKDEFAALVLLDLDDFKDINDVFGHTIGDEVIVHIAYFLRKSLNHKDIICYLGADKFLIFARSVFNKEDVKEKINIIFKSINNNFRVKGNEVYVNANIGISLYPQHGTNEEILMKNAYTAINHSKYLGKNSYSFFDNEINSEIMEGVQLEIELRHALENKEFKLVYQPKIRVDTGEIEGMEALVRWFHPQKGVILPSKFIPIAEQNGMIKHIGKFVMKTAIMQNKTWQNMGYKHLRVAINLSVNQLQQENFLQIVNEILKESSLNPKWIEFEITESVIMKDFNKITEVLGEIQQLGIQISLDDFGTGYSSLNYLKSLPINCIKIDKSFVDGIMKTEKEGFIASSIIKLAHGIKLNVVAEGVESIEQLNILKSYKCDEIQGYLVSKPLLREEFQKIIYEKYIF